MKPVRIGFIGAGRIAERQIESLKKLQDVQVLAVAARDSEKVKDFSAKHEIPRFFTDWKSLLALSELDAVSVCTPNDTHCATTVEALKAGKHVLVEKPMAKTLLEALEMEKAAKDTGRVLQIGFQERFSPPARAISSQIKAGLLGDPLYVRVRYLRRRGIPNWGVYGSKSIQGGGPLIDIGVHMLEMAHYLIGSPKPLTATGSVYRYFGREKHDEPCRWPDWDRQSYDVEDLATGYVRFQGGTTLSIETSFAAYIKENRASVEIMGTKGGATSDPLEFFTDTNGYMVDMKPAYLHETSGFDYKMQHFIDCVRGNAECLSPARDGILVQQIIDALYRSADQGHEINIS